MSPIDWAMRPLQKYADFAGRAPRAEYWWFYLLYFVALIFATIVDSLIGSHLVLNYGFVSLLVGLGFLVPMLAAGVRRLHDTDRSGWWLLIGFVPLIGAIVLLVFFVSGGTAGPNRFGDNPYGATDRSYA
jgi:uncharacterized membrane protein YhaH (DUF805 family)